MSTAGMIKPLSLYLTRNEAIGDSGLAALSAAIRTVTSKNKGVTVFEVLDLSGCGIGDTGAEALAIALENHPLCVRHLNLSNNQISDEGATALGRALLSSLESNNRCVIETLDLSHNNGIGDSGAKSIAGALEQGTVVNVILRSCHIHADGAASFAKSLRAIGHRSSTCTSRPALLRVDLSGNPLGILRKKSKSGAGKYSATALRSKASARTAAYMNLIGKTVQKGLKDLGISEGPDTLESDDDEEAKMKGEEDNDSQDPSKVKCGALAFADAFIDDEDDEDEGADVGEEPSVEAPADERVVCKIELGLRHCSFDTRAAEALAAVVLEAKSSSGMSMDLTIDARMNNVLEDETISALSGDSKYESDLDTMAETYHEAMEALRIARQRAQEAAKAAAARMKAEAEMDAAWGAPIEMRDDYDDDYQWDSDADYDDGEYSDFF